MHPSANRLMHMFFDTYIKDNLLVNNPVICELGSANYHDDDRYKIRLPDNTHYIGVDFQAANNVDVVLEDPYKLPFDDNSIDAIVSSSVLEHSEFFWLTILEMFRVLKPSGLLYVNAPFNGSYHTYPVDCWRFYPDAGDSFVNWGKRNGYSPFLLESFINKQNDFPISLWNDFVCIIVKDVAYKDLYPNQIIDNYKDVWFGKSERIPMFNIAGCTEDQIRIFKLLNWSVSSLDSTVTDYYSFLDWK